jgi:predicted permease
MDRWLPDIRERLAPARLDPAREAEIAQELAQHLDDRYAELRRDGTAPDDARAQALDELKDHARMREQLAAVERRESTVPPAGTPNRGRLLAGLWQDVRYALRSLRLNPGFAALALTTLALGIAATTVIYAVVDTVLLRPLPYKDADRIVLLWKTHDGDLARRSAVSYPNFRDWQEASHRIDALAVVTNATVVLADGQPEEIEAAAVSQAFLAVHRVRPLHGRDFVPADFEPGAAPVCLLGYRMWQRRFAGDAGVVGRRIQTTDGVVEVIGVLPDVRIYWGEANVIVPFTPSAAMARGRGFRTYPVLGRLAPDVTLAQAQAEMDAIARRLAEAHPETNAVSGVWLQPVREVEVGTLREPLAMFLAAVLCVLLIACVNVAGLQVARGVGRSHEIAMRTALGASRWRLMRQLLTESVVVALMGGALGVMLAWWLFAALLPLLPVRLPADVAAIDARVFGLVLSASVFTGLLFGALPATGASAARRPVVTLKDGVTTSRAWGRRVGSGLLLVEMALAIVLLAGAGLMIRTLMALHAINPGFEPRGTVVWRVTPVLTGGSDVQSSRREDFYRSLLEAVRDMPGVRSAALADTPPLGGRTSSTGVTPHGGTSRVGIVTHLVSPGYFTTLGIPILEGRDFAETDRSGAPVAIVSATAAARLWPGQRAVGRRLVYHSPGVTTEPHEVLGVAGDVRHRSLEIEALPEVYRMFAQQAGDERLVVLARTDQPRATLAALPAHVAHLPDRAIAEPPRMFDELIGATTRERRHRGALFGIVAGLGLLLAIVGIVGVTAHAVAQRTREIAIRMALGAQQARVLRLIMGGLAVPIAGGIALGLLGAWGASRWVESFLFGVERTDPIAFAAAALLLAAAAVVACYVPARRALRVDPVVALRAE